MESSELSESSVDRSADTLGSPSSPPPSVAPTPGDFGVSELSGASADFSAELEEGGGTLSDLGSDMSVSRSYHDSAALNLAL
jgi:hypothetical protein